MPYNACTRSPEMPSRKTAWIGMPPQTEASMARLIPAWMARSQIWGPLAAMSSLLAVTTLLRLAMAASTMRAATLMPPASSATICTSGWDTPWRQSVVLNTSQSPAGMCFVCTERLHTATTDRKSTRLNSSHLVISYAVFCLKKETKKIEFLTSSYRPDTKQLISGACFTQESFFFNDTATTEIYTLSLHDALPI